MSPWLQLHAFLWNFILGTSIKISWENWSMVKIIQIFGTLHEDLSTFYIVDSDMDQQYKRGPLLCFHGNSFNIPLVCCNSYWCPMSVLVHMLKREQKETWCSVTLYIHCMSYWLIPSPVRMSIFMNLINFHYAISPKHFTNLYNEATGMYACLHICIV